MVRSLVFGLVVGLIVGVSPAQAAPDPVAALKKQFRDGHGVLVTETASTLFKGLKEPSVDTTRGRIGADGYELRTRMTASESLLEHLGYKPDDLPAAGVMRTIKVGKYTYVNPFDWGDRPIGKPWTRFGGKDNAEWQEYGQRGDQQIDVLDPKRLSIVLGRATRVKPGEYRGTIKTAELYPKRMYDQKTITFQLFLDVTGLPVRLVTRYSAKDREPNAEGKWISIAYAEVVDTRYSRWGAKVSVKAPSKADWVDWKDLPFPGSEPEMSPVKPSIVTTF